MNWARLGKFRVRKSSLFLFSLLIIVPNCAQGQRGPRIAIRVSNGSSSAVVKFGSVEGATSCIDTALGEYELPPIPPLGVMDVRFLDFSNACLGQGLNINYHTGHFHSAFWSDTFQFVIQRRFTDSTTVISWNTDSTSAYSTSMHMIDNVVGAQDIDMRTTSSKSMGTSGPGRFFDWMIMVDWKDRIVECGPCAYLQVAPRLIELARVSKDQPVSTITSLKAITIWAVPIQIYQIKSSSPQLSSSLVPHALYNGENVLDTITLASGATSDFRGFVEYSSNSDTSPDTVFIHSSVLAAAEDPKLKPKQFSLSQNYPNPFNPSTSIQYEIPERTYVRIDVFDPLGRMVGELVKDEKQPGAYVVSWNSTGLASGVYYSRMNAVPMSHPASPFSDLKPMIVVR